MKTASLFALALAALASSASAQTISGRYQVQGKNFNGTNYSGTAEIVSTANNTCRITWVTGSTTSRGICMRNGNSFAAGYNMSGAVGLVIYEVKPDGSLDGLWTIADQPGMGTERLVPVK
jgi:hypothetical protein